MKYAAIFGILASALLLIMLFNSRTAPAEAEHNHIERAGLQVAVQDTTEPNKEYPFQKSETEWKQILTSKEYRILREKGTELPYVNEYNKNERKGIYVCGACGQELYSSEHKYESGSGWPSFWKPIADSLVEEKEDNSFFMQRVEIVCSNCGSHLGHVFADGPEPTGLRYCMNSLAMDFIEKDDLQTN